MQLRSQYYTTNKKARAAELRREAMTCDKAGYRDAASVNRHLASWIDPRGEDRPPH